MTRRLSRHAFVAHAWGDQPHCVRCGRVETHQTHSQRIVLHHMRAKDITVLEEHLMQKFASFTSSGWKLPRWVREGLQLMKETCRG